MFWVLVGMAAAVFAPCVLLPVWREYQALKYAEQIEQAAVEQARDDLFSEHRRLAALQNDPAVIARLAQRDLHYRQRGERVISVAIHEDPVQDSAVPLAPVVPPAPLARLFDHLPQTDYDRLFSHGQTRTILMCLAGGLVLAALVLFPARQRIRVGPIGPIGPI